MGTVVRATSAGAQTRRMPLRAKTAVGAAALALSASALGAGLAMPAASARPAKTGVVPHTGSAVVVKISPLRTHGTTKFKNVLTTTATVGKTLYTAATCNQTCQAIWPPLLMPVGKTIPLGPKTLVGKLRTIHFGKTRLQVTYNGHPLYTFVSDSGASVNGNNVGGFTVIANA